MNEEEFLFDPKYPVRPWERVLAWFLALVFVAGIAGAVLFFWNGCTKDREQPRHYHATLHRAANLGQDR